MSRWRTLKEDYELESYKKDAESDKLRNPDERVALYKNLQDIQLKNNQRKKKLLHNFILENPDTVNKNNINKWNEELKKINDAFDG